MKTIACAVVVSLLSVPVARAAEPCCPPAGAAVKAPAAGACCPPTAQSAADNKVTLKVIGMTCGKCASSVESALKKVEGVKAAEVSLDNGRAVVTVDASSRATPDKLIAAVDQAGGSRHAFKAEQLAAKAVDPKLVSFFSVPLVCSAAPEIGCGGRAKPILTALQGDSNISEAWLNRTGTVLAVVGIESSSRESRGKAVRAALEAKGATAKELDGEVRERELKSFASGDGWYRGADVDKLSEQEARIIAARLVRRIRAKVALPDEKASALEVGFAGAFSRSFTAATGEAEGKRQEHRNDELLRIARANLDESGVAAFREATAQGYRPQPNEK